MAETLPMKHLRITFVYFVTVIALKIASKAKGEKNDRSNPHYSAVGINFANILAGNLYPDRGLNIKY